MEKHTQQEAREKIHKIKKLIADGVVSDYKEARRVIAVSDKQKNIWDRKWSTKSETGSVSSFATDVLLNIGSGNKDLLDLGAGDGKDSIEFARHGHRVVAIDFSKEGITQLEKAANKFGVEVATRIENIETASLSENSFDVIYSNLGLHFFNDKVTRKIFAKIHRALRDGGVFYLTAKAVSDDNYGKGKEIGPDTFEHNGKLRHFFSEDYTKSLLSAFTKVKIKTVNEEQKLLEGGTYKASYIKAKASK